MYTLGAAPLPAGLGSGSARWAAAPGGFLWLWVRGLGLSVSFRLRGAGFNFLAAVCVGGPPPLLPGARWPLAGVWRAGAVPSEVCGGFFWLVLRLAFLALVLWCAAVRRGAPCRAVVCRYVPRRVVSRRNVLCFGLHCLGALHCGALRCGGPCRLVLCCGGSVEVSLACVVVRSAGRSVAGWWLGDAVRCGCFGGSVLWGPGRAARVGRSGRCPWGCHIWGACALVPCPSGVWAPSPGCCGRAFVLLRCL